MGTKFGKCIRFMSKKMRLFKGRSSKGIRGINLQDNDSVMSLSVLIVLKAQVIFQKKWIKKLSLTNMFYQ